MARDIRVTMAMVDAAMKLEAVMQLDPQGDRPDDIRRLCVAIYRAMHAVGSAEAEAELKRIFGDE